MTLKVFLQVLNVSAELQPGPHRNWGNIRSFSQKRLFGRQLCFCKLIPQYVLSIFSLDNRSFCKLIPANHITIQFLLDDCLIYHHFHIPVRSMIIGSHLELHCMCSYMCLFCNYSWCYLQYMNSDVISDCFIEVQLCLHLFSFYVFSIVINFYIKYVAD